MPLRLRTPAQKGRQSNSGYFWRGLYLGGALAALGLLTGCRWDNDDTYHLRPSGTYLQADSSLYFLPAQETALLFLQAARAMGADGHIVAALSIDGRTLTFYEPGSPMPVRTLTLPAACHTLAPRPEREGFLVGGPSGLWEITPTYQLKPADEAPTLALLTHGSFILALESPIQLTVRHPRPPYLPLTTLSLPGPLHSWHTEGPIRAAGTFTYRDTLWNFSYRSDGRIFTLDTLRPSSYRKRVVSPYLTPRWGTEYTGTLALSAQGTLNPLNLSSVRSFAMDFLGSYLYYVRLDTLWQKDMKTNQVRAVAAPFEAQKLEVVGVYTYGRARITTR